MSGPSRRPILARTKVDMFESTPPDVAVTVYEQDPSLCLTFTKTCSIKIRHELFNGDVLLEGDPLAVVSSTKIELTADA